MKHLVKIAVPAAMAGGVMQINLLVGQQVASYFDRAVGVAALRGSPVSTAFGCGRHRCRHVSYCPTCPAAFKRGMKPVRKTRFRALQKSRSL